MNQPSATNAMTPSAAPTPIPAFAPVEKLLLDGFEDATVDVGLAVAEEEEEVRVVNFVKAVGDDDIVDDKEEVVVCVVKCIVDVIDDDIVDDEIARAP
jgi:hypothetical protein